MRTKIKPTPLTPGAEAFIDRLGDQERRQKALALAGLLAIAARECSSVVARGASEEVRNGLCLIEDDHIEDLADLLGLAPKRT